jgi:hypothetical protein
MGGGNKKHSATWLSGHLGLPLSEDRFYRVMDKLSGKTDKVKDLAFYNGRKLCDNRISLVLFDATILYFESFLDDDDEILSEKLPPAAAPIAKTSDTEPQAANDAGFKEVLSLVLHRHGFNKDREFKEAQVLILVASSEGILLRYGVFPGNTAECLTLQNMINEVSENRKVLKQVSVGYVLGASVKKLDKATRKKALDLTSFTELDDVSILY